MGNPSGFLNIKRKEGGYRPVEERVHDYREVEVDLPEDARKEQASRCMDCGVPFCHWACPVSNIMPEWQDKIYQGDFKSAYEMLQETNNFPEFTGRVCPAPCEASCVLSINDDAVTIRNNELFVIEKAFKEGYVKPKVPSERTGKKIAVIGSGPAGLACADLLNKAGHTVVLYEADDAVGGYLRYGIPDFKLDKNIIDRRVDILKQEGLIIKTGTKIGKNISDLKKEFDAVCITAGARQARDLNIPGRDLKGIYFALEYLSQQNKIVKGAVIPEEDLIRAYNKYVVVIGGGDTGSDCVGSANRQGASKITQIELLPRPNDHRTEDEPWPLWPKLLKTSSSHEEGCERMWNILTKKFNGENGILKSISAVLVEWYYDARNYKMKEIPGTDFEIKADMAFLAMGFLHVEHDLADHLGLKLDLRGNIAVDANYSTNVDSVFAAGDSVAGASLVVRAISQGREAAHAIDSYLRKE
ncbi:MAG: glutamate synthase subunit beta [Spirochaetota bacterium]